MKHNKFNKSVLRKKNITRNIDHVNCLTEQDNSGIRNKIQMHSNVSYPAFYRLWCFVTQHTTDHVLPTKNRFRKRFSSAQTSNNLTSFISDRHLLGNLEITETFTTIMLHESHSSRYVYGYKFLVIGNSSIPDMSDISAFNLARFKIL